MAENENLQAKMEGLATLLVLDDEIRKLTSIREFGFFSTNETHRLIPYHTAYLWQAKGITGAKLLAQSGTAEIDVHSLSNQWLENQINHLCSQPHANKTHQTTLEKETGKENESDSISGIEHIPLHALWCPLLNKSQELTGGLLLLRETAFSEAEVKMLSWLLASYQYTWQVLSTSKRFQFLNQASKRPYLIIGLIIILGIMLFPVRISVLGTGIVVAKNPVLINAPMQGVIKAFTVNPGQTVKAGQLLLVLDKTDLQASVEVSKRDLLLTQARLRTAINESFDRKENSSDIPILRAQLTIDQAHLDYTNALLAKSDITSPMDGIVVFDSKEDWTGQPVQTGERILVVANPNSVSLKIYLPITNAIQLTVGAKGEFFLYGQLSTLPITIKSLGYNAKMTPNKILSYQLSANFSDQKNIPQLGSQGTVRLYGQRVPFVYYLIRRPLNALRQTLGI